MSASRRGSQRLRHSTARRDSHCQSRRHDHAALRQNPFLAQNWPVSSEGPRDSPQALKAAKAQKARKA